MTIDFDNRFDHHPPKDDATIEAHASVRWAVKDIAKYLSDVVPEGRELNLVMTKLEEVLFWANAGIARN